MSQENLISHGLACLSLGEALHNGVTIHFSIHLVLENSSMGLFFGTRSLLGLHLPLGVIPLGACIVLRESMLLGVPPSLGENTLLENLMPLEAKI
jgi:hypothetical protein